MKSEETNVRGSYEETLGTAWIKGRVGTKIIRKPLLLGSRKTKKLGWGELRRDVFGSVAAKYSRFLQEHEVTMASRQ